MWELDHKEDWALKNWCFRSVVLEKTLESPLENKEIKPVNLKGNQPWILFERTDAEAEAPILWLPDVHWKSPWCWERLRAEEEGTEDEMVGWHHWFNGITELDWANSGRWWGIGKPSVLQSMESRRVGHDLETKQEEQHIYMCSWFTFAVQQKLTEHYE